jgi:hypothetical protein
MPGQSLSNGNPEPLCQGKGCPVTVSEQSLPVHTKDLKTCYLFISG